MRGLAGRRCWNARPAAAGVPTPEFVEPDGDAVGLWTRVADGRYARAIRRLHGMHPATPLEPSLAKWAGRCMALIERTNLPVDATAEARYRLYPIEEWKDWITQAQDLGVLTAAQAIGLTAVVADLNAVVAAGEAVRPVVRLLHRDVSRVNIMLTAHGPRLGRVLSII